MTKAHVAEGGGSHRFGFWLGLTIVLVGLALLGYVGWQLYGTNYVSKRDQERTTEQLLDLWENGEGIDAESVGATGRGGSGGSSSGGSSTYVSYASVVGKPTALVRIPRFGSSYVVPVFEGTSDEVLARGYGHFQYSEPPGAVGNYALAAHRITHGEPLRRMPELRPGDKVIIETRRAIYTYVLDTNPNDLIVPFSKNWVLAPLPDNPKRGGPEPEQVEGQAILTLTTCSELFHTDNRMVAFGHLVRTTPK